MSAVDYIKKRYSGFVKRPGQIGIAGWLFDIVDDDGINRSADITDHFVEAGNAIQDHMVIKPTRVTMRGFIGELVYQGASNEIQRAAEAVRDRLAAIPGLPGAQAIQAAQKATALVNKVGYIAGQASAFLQRAKNIVDTVRGVDDSPTKQEKAFKDLDALFTELQPVEVETPWGIYPAMLIESIDTMQGPESKYISEISITLKEYRETGTETTNFEDNPDANAADIQAAPDQANGRVDGIPKFRDSFLFSGLGGIF